MAAFYRSSTVPFHRRVPRKKHSMNSRAKCTACKSFFPQSEAVWSNGPSRICSSECLSAYMDRNRPSRPAIKAKRALKKAKAETTLPLAVRQAVRARDGLRCRWCGAGGEQVHHVLYRSQGGSDDLHNLVLLCTGCHSRAHSSKKAFQPILLAYIWLVYSEGSTSIPDVVRRLRRNGLLSDLQEERLTQTW